MKTNAAGVALIKECETLQLQAYPDPASPRAVHRRATGKDDPKLSAEPWTIGWGHTGDVREGMRITAHQADVILTLDLERFERDVATLTRGLTLNENEFSALVCFAFNVGSDMDGDGKAEGLGDSTLLRKLRDGAPRVEVAAEFGKWVNAKGQRMPGLVKRRAAEAALFLEPVRA